MAQTYKETHCKLSPLLKKSHCSASSACLLTLSLLNKATVHSCILSPSATHNWTVGFTAYADLIGFTVFFLFLSPALYHLFSPLLFLNQSTLSSLIALNPFNPLLLFVVLFSSLHIDPCHQAVGGADRSRIQRLFYKCIC